ncbi:MAG: FecR domain-containing protein [Pseudomonadota bacterium]
MTRSDLEERKEILRTAHDWRYRMSQPDTSQIERLKFENWLLSDPRHAELYDRAVTFYHAMGTLKEDALGKNVMRKAGLERWHDLRVTMVDLLQPKLVRYAAAGVAMASVALVSVMMFTTDQTAPVVETPALAELYETTIGDVQSYTLTDGTVMTLGAASRVELTYSDRHRTAMLSAGSAVFDVVPDPNKPFIVEAGELNARVLGTVFDVTRSGDTVRVSVAEGKVEVSHPFIFDNSQSSMMVRRELEAGQQIASREAKGLGAISAVRVETVGAWRDNTLYYQGARLSELVADANRYSPDRVVIEGDVEKISNYLVQGSFNSKDIEGMLSVLSEVYPVRIDRSEPGVISIRDLEKTD